MLANLKKLPIYQRVRKWAIFKQVKKLLKGRQMTPCQACQLFPDLKPLDFHNYEWFADLNDISMLHIDTLIALNHLARHSQGTIVEIGPYIGGSTVSIARGLRDQGQPRAFLTVELGGVGHNPLLPSTNIVADLEKNLTRYGLRHLVSLLVGWSYDGPIVAELRKVAAKNPIGLMVVDANGENIEGELERLGPYCRRGCYLVFDDYVAMHEPMVKAIHVKITVDRLVRQGKIIPIGVLPHGLPQQLHGSATWFGRLAG